MIQVPEQVVADVVEALDEAATLLRRWQNVLHEEIYEDETNDLVERIRITKAKVEAATHATP